MKIIWTTLLLLIQSYHTIDSQLHDEYNQYSFYQKRPLSPRPLDVMADLTNDLGANVLRVIAAGGAIGNIAFSPFGLMAVSVLLYEGSSGYSALQIKQSLNLPWEVLAVRVGVRDLNRYLKTYFKSDGFLNGLTMSREEVCLRPQFKQVLRIYGFDNPNDFLIDSCPQSAMTTIKPIQPMSVTTHGTVITEMTPTSQMIQVLANLTNSSASDLSMAATDRPAKVTYLGDATFTISNIKTNTNQPMKSQTDVMIVDIETQPNLRPIESSTNQVETTVLINKQNPKPFSKAGITNKPSKTSIATTNFVTESTLITSIDPMTVEATVTQIISSHDGVTNPQFEKIMGTKNNSGEPHTDPVEISTKHFHESNSTDDTLHTSVTENMLDDDPKTVLLSDFVTSTENKLDVTDAFTDNTENATIDHLSFTINNRMDSKIDDIVNKKYVFVKNMTETMTSTKFNIMTTDDYKMTKNNLFNFEVDNTADTTPPTTFKSNDGDRSITTFGITSIPSIPTLVVDKSTPSTKFGFNNNDDTTTIVDENIMSTTDVLSTTLDLSNATENEIIKEAESNQHYEIASLENKNARSMESNDSLPTFNIEFVVRKEDLRTGCNHTRKKTIIKPDRILTEYPKNSGVSITLRKSKKRRRRHLEQYQGYNGNRNQWHNGHKNYGSWPGLIDRSSEDQFETANSFNSGYRRIPFFTYTAVLPFGFIFELKSQVIEIPLDDPKYTLMILMPNHQDGLSELLLLLPTISLRYIHNSLKPTAVHATIPTFKYTAKVDLTSALQQIGIQDVFYRYRADLSFMSPDARLFVSSVQQVVSVTAKKYNTPPVYEIQRKYVERDFVVSRPFVYFVMDIHTKVSLIAGVITDPLASPIWV